MIKIMMKNSKLVFLDSQSHSGRQCRQCARPGRTYVSASGALGMMSTAKANTHRRRPSRGAQPARNSQ